MPLRATSDKNDNSFLVARFVGMTDVRTKYHALGRRGAMAVDLLDLRSRATAEAAVATWL
jgi:hypothetical protein